MYTHFVKWLSGHSVAKTTTGRADIETLIRVIVLYGLFANYVDDIYLVYIYFPRSFSCRLLPFFSPLVLFFAFFCFCAVLRISAAFRGRNDGPQAQPEGAGVEVDGLAPARGVSHRGGHIPPPGAGIHSASPALGVIDRTNHPAATAAYSINMFTNY